MRHFVFLRPCHYRDSGGNLSRRFTKPGRHRIMSNRHREDDKIAKDDKDSENFSQNEIGRKLSPEHFHVNDL